MGVRATPVAVVAAAALGALVAAALPAAALAQDGDDLGARVNAVLVAKCASCHEPGSEDPKAQRFLSDVNDLAVVVDEVVEPGDPDFSPLWEQLEGGSMPPEDSDVPPLDADELALVREWIVAGAPLPEPPTPETEEGTEPAQAGTEELPTVPETADAKDDERLVRWLGRLHPAAVHLPIGLLLGALLAELGFLVSRAAGLRSAARYCVATGALSAVVAASLGWQAGDFHTGNADHLETHRWVAVSATLMALLTLVASEAAARKPERWTGRYRLALFATAIVVGVAGHFGGVLTFGPGYLDF